jgi:hypothetical protein
MAQAGAAEASGACNVQRMAALTVSEAVAGLLRKLALGLDDEHRFCVRMVELVQIACGNNRTSAQEFMKTHEQGLLEAAGKREQRTRMSKWNGAKAVWTCDVSCAERVMLWAADQKKQEDTASKEHITQLAGAIKEMACDEAQKRVTKHREIFVQSIGVDASRVDRSEGTPPSPQGTGSRATANDQDDGMSSCDDANGRAFEARPVHVSVAQAPDGAWPHLRLRAGSNHQVRALHEGTWKYEGAADGEKRCQHCKPSAQVTRLLHATVAA